MSKSVFRHLNCLLAVDAQGVHDAQHRLTVVAQVGIVLCQGMREDLACSWWVCQHPAVLFDLGNRDPPGRVHHQHFTDQIFTVWRRLKKRMSVGLGSSYSQWVIAVVNCCRQCTLRHEERDSESSLCDSLSKCRKAGSIEWKRATDQNIKHNTKALRGK